jgi:hypothetical protein
VAESGSSVEQAGDAIVVRLRGKASEALLRQVQDEVLRLAARASRPRVLVDMLELSPPPVELAALQRKLDEDSRAAGLRRAIVVPDSRLAYFARLAFGEGNYRIFYNDRVAAMKWLGQELPVGS